MSFHYEPNPDNEAHNSTSAPRLTAEAQSNEQQRHAAQLFPVSSGVGPLRSPHLQPSHDARPGIADRVHDQVDESENALQEISPAPLFRLFRFSLCETKVANP